MKQSKPNARDPMHPAVVSSERVRWTGQTTRVAPPGLAGECEPRVELIRDGAQVRAIDIRCTCGKRIYLQCEY